MTISIETFDQINSLFEATCLVPSGLSLISLWRARNTEALSLPATIWWLLYLVWVTIYLWFLDQPISSIANGIVCLMYGAMVYLLVTRHIAAKVNL